jgi:hypothetical protein
MVDAVVGAVVGVAGIAVGVAVTGTGDGIAGVAVELVVAVAEGVCVATAGMVRVGGRLADSNAASGVLVWQPARIKQKNNTW